jgi:hypothetical protein
VYAPVYAQNARKSFNFVGPPGCDVDHGQKAIQAVPFSCV